MDLHFVFLFFWKIFKTAPAEPGTLPQHIADRWCLLVSRAAKVLYVCLLVFLLIVVCFFLFLFFSCLFLNSLSLQVFFHPLFSSGVLKSWLSCLFSKQNWNKQYRRMSTRVFTLDNSLLQILQSLSCQGFFWQQKYYWNISRHIWQLFAFGRFCCYLSYYAALQLSPLMIVIRLTTIPRKIPKRENFPNSHIFRI